MSPSPGRDVEQERHFVAWLAARDPELASEAAPLLDRLHGLGGLDRAGPTFADTLTDAGLGDDESERLLQVHAAWTGFRREGRSQEDAIPWVGEERASPGDASVQWVGSSSGPAGAPAGPAPSLLAPGARPRRPKPKRARGWLRLSDLLVPAALVLALVTVFLPAVLERGRVQQLRRDAAAAVTNEPSQGARAARLEHQASLAAWLLRLRDDELEFTRGSCEGGPWCQARVAELERSRALAAQLLEDARAQGATPATSWQAPGDCVDSLSARIAELQARARQLTEAEGRQAREILRWEADHLAGMRRR